MPGFAAALACLLAAGAGTVALRLTHRPDQVPPATVTITAGALTFRSAAAQPAAHRPGHSTGRAASGMVTDLHPDRGITIRASGGRLASVSMTSGSGQPVTGLLAGPGIWRSAWALAPASTYQVTAVAVNRLGRRSVATAVFRTVRPRRTFSAASGLAAGRVYGVGMPIMIDFSRPVAAAEQAALERTLQIFSSRPVTGAWYWMNGAQVWFRPRHYWPAHTLVRLDAHLRGMTAAPSVYAERDLCLAFRIGNSLVAVASAATHHMKVWWNGRLRGDWPISTGEPGLDTPAGRYLSFAMGNPVDMDSSTFGVMPGKPGYYNVMVYDSVQFTGSGDYIHSAPWSVGDQGYVNVSHGCVNLAPQQAAWYYDHSLIGDPISIVGSPLRGVWGDGWTIWFLSWPKLIGGSATGQAVAVGPGGSRFIVPSLPALTVRPQARLRSALSG